MSALTSLLLMSFSFKIETWPDDRVCDVAWFTLRGATLGPTGAYWDRRKQECRQADGYTMWMGQDLWVFTGRPCGMSDYRRRLSRTVGRRVELEAWVLTPDAWRAKKWVVGCGTIGTNEPVNSRDFDNAAWGLP